MRGPGPLVPARAGRLITYDEPCVPASVVLDADESVGVQDGSLVKGVRILGTEKCDVSVVT